MTRHVTLMTLEDAEHFSPEEREALWNKYPDHEREARGKGIPMLGSGRVYALSDEQVKCPEAFQTPSHWPVIGGIDFGFGHPTAAVRIAHDLDADITYITHIYRVKEATPIVHAGALRAWGNIPWAWPHDGEHETAAGAGVDLATQYRNQGLDMLAERAKFEKMSRKAGQSTSRASVQAGIMELLDRMQGGRLKVFPHLWEWFEEFRLYHRKDGKVVKQFDDLMDATRYAHMMLRYARVVVEKKRKRRDRAPVGGWMGA